MYWDRSNFILGSKLYFEFREQPLILDSDLPEQLDTIVRWIQYYKVKTLYVNSEDDLVFLEYIKGHLKNDYNYNEDFTMEVKN